MRVTEHDCVCPACRGSGGGGEDPALWCRTCRGTGLVPAADRSDDEEDEGGPSGEALDYLSDASDMNWEGCPHDDLGGGGA